MEISARALWLPLVAIFAALPLWGGCEAHRAFRDGTAVLDEFAGDQVRATTAYHQGWLRSTAETTLEPAIGTGQGVTLHHTITHGPIAFGELLDGRLPGRPVAAIVETVMAPDGEDPEAAPRWLRLRTRVGLSGRRLASFSSPPHRSSDGRVSWAGLQGGLSVGPGAGEGSVLFEAPRLSIDEGGVLLAVHDVAGEVALRELRGLTLAEVTLALGRVELVSDEAHVELRDLRFGQRSEEDLVDESLRVVTSASLLGLSVGDDVYGPGVFELVLRGLDPDVLREINGPHAAGEDPATRSLRLLGRLLAGSPELELTRFELPGPGGTLSASARIAVDGDDPALSLGPLFALSAVSAEGDLWLPAGLLHRALDDWMPASGGPSRAMRRAEWLREVAASGLLVREPEGYRLRAALDGGQVRVNGRPYSGAPLVPGPTATP